MMLTDIQKAELAKPLDRSAVKTRDLGNAKLSYVESWHVIAEANRIFGFDGWDSETVETIVLVEKPRKIGKGQYERDGWGVTYRAKVRVTVKGNTREGSGAGHGIDADLGLAHENALKEAESDARKRALMTFGNPFGLALYDKDQNNVADLPNPILATLIDNLKKQVTHAACVEWKAKQKSEIDGLNDADFEAFKAAWQSHIKQFSQKEAA